ncbi:MAG: type II-A CRISPR-associated protein Csn2 [Lachnospiraceae bacterium]|nr:type II-A CRISPR-associated protein Csn2 [Lachnospiraceae bacterium]
MKIATDLFQEVIEIKEGEAVSLIIENPRIHFELLKQIHCQINGGESDVIFSEDNGIIKASKKVELFNVFPLTDLNEKRIISRLSSLLEEESLNENNYADCTEVLSHIERFVYKISDSIPYNVICSNLSLESIIKACGIRIEDDCETDIERIIVYMNIVRELLGKKLFIITNLKTYFDSNDIALFVDMVRMQKQYVLLLDGIEGDNITGLQRIIIDRDLCVF